MIASAPRTGSTLLTGALRSTGRLGVPAEYLNPEMISAWANEWGIPAEDAPGSRRYFDAILEAGTTPNGVCGIKLFGHHALQVEALSPGIMSRFGGQAGHRTVPWSLRMIHTFGDETSSRRPVPSGGL